MPLRPNPPPGGAPSGTIRNNSGAAATTTATTTAAPLSLADLARTRASALLEEIVTESSVLTKTMMPHEGESKALRKKIARLRDTLDVFVHVWGGPQESAWQRLRARVDTGYERIGHFKDLFDSQDLTILGSDPKNPTVGVKPEDVKYDATVVKKRRDEVMSWKTGFLDDNNLKEARDLIANPSSTPLPVKKELLTRFYWGAVNIVPDPALSGPANVKRLGSQLIDDAQRDLKKLLSSPSVRGDANETAFHDVRKRLRSIANLAGSFPEILDNADKAAPLLKTINTFVSRFGDVEDRLVALHLATDAGDTAAIAKHEGAIDAAWTQLKTTIKGDKLDATLGAIGELV